MTTLLDGRYELCERIGSGGVARVHRAVDHRLGRQVAIKLLDDEAAAQADPTGRERFLREAQTAARIHHPHVVSVFDAGESDGRLFLVMELVEGPTLAEVIADRAPLSDAEATSLTVQLLSALAAAHDHGIVHRDVKPANVIVDAAGDAHLTDFGIARRLDEIEDHLTSNGLVMGTPAYLAPEQATGGELGPRTDVYLAGLILDELVTGRRTSGEPVPVASAASLAAGAAAFDPRDVSPCVGEHVASVVLRATDPDPGARYASAGDMAEALVDVLDGVLDEVAVTTALAAPGPPSGGGTQLMPGALVMAGAAAGPAHAVESSSEDDPTAALAPSRGADDDAEPLVVIPPTGRRRPLLAVVVVLAALAVVLLVGSALGGSDEPSPADVTAVPSVVTTAPATPPPTTAAPVAEPSPDRGGPPDNGGRGNGRGDGNGNGNGNGRG